MGRKSTVVLLGFIILAAVVGMVWSTQSRSVLAQVEHSLAGQLSAALGSPVTVEKLELTSFNSIHLSNIAIYDKKQEQLAYIKETSISYNPISLFFGNKALDAISAIQVVEPSLWLKQREDGRWNIEDVWEGKASESQEFQGKLTIEKGQVSVVANAGTWKLEELKGKVDFSSYPAMGVDVRALYKGKEMTLAGQFNAKGRTGLTLYAQELPADDLKVFLPENISLQIVGGSVKQIEINLVQEGGKRQWAGEARFIDVAGELEGNSLTGVEGRATFANQKVYLLANGNWKEQPLRASGTLTLGQGAPLLALQLESKAFDTRVLGEQLPVQGLAAFALAISGRGDQPVLDGWIKLPEGHFQQYTLTNGEAKIHMEGQQLELRQLSLEALGGQLSAKGTIFLNDQSYALQILGKHVDLQGLGDAIPQVKGYGDITASVRGKGSLADANFSGNIAVGQGQVAGVVFDSLQAGFQKQQEQWIVDYANVTVGKGQISASGKMEGQNLFFTAYGNQVPLKMLENIAPEVPMEGSARFAGTLSGTLGQPHFAAEFSAVEGSAFYQPFTQAKGELSITREALELKRLVLSEGSTTHEVQGTVGLEGSKELHVSVVTKKARAENLVKLLSPGEKLTGNVDNQLIITGPLADYRLEGQLLLTDGSFRGQLIAKGEGKYVREHGRLHLQDFTIASLNTQIAVSGTMEPDKNLNLSVSANPIDVERLHLNLPYPVKGQAKFTGKLTGTTEHPIFNGELFASQLSINHQEFTQISGQVQLQGEQLDIPFFQFRQGSGLCTFRGGMDMASGEIYGGLDVQEVQVESILPVFNVTDKGVTGRLKGHIRVAGTAKNPDIWLTGGLTQGSIKKYPLDYIQVNLALENRVLKVYELSARQGNGVLKAAGTADLDGELKLEVGGENIDAGLISTWFDMAVPTQGQLQFAAQITGTTQSPHAAVSLEVNKGGIGSATFDSLYGLFILEKGNIQVNQVLLLKGPYRASAYGNIPVAALNPPGRRQATEKDQMNLKMRLDEADLSILPLLTKEVAWASGPTQGEVVLSGTVVEPALHGSITVKEGSLKLAALSEPLEKVNVDIQFAGDYVQVKKMSGNLGGGFYSLEGRGRLTGNGFKEYQLSLNLDNLGIKSKYFTGPVNGKLSLTEAAGKPNLSGKIVFENDTVNIPALPEFGEASWDALLDVDVEVGKKVRLYNPMLYDITTAGHVHFGGSVKEPSVTGRIGVVRGTVSYLGTQFKVTEGRADFTQVASFEPVLRLSAQARLLQTIVNLSVNGPVRSMEFALSSEPAMSQQQIISLLTLRSRYFEKQNGGSGLGKEEFSTILDAGLQARFVGEVEGQFRNALGLDEFRIVRDTSSDIVKKNYNDREEFATVTREVYNLEVGKYVSDKLLFNYTLGLDYKKSEWAFRYDLNRNLSFNGSVDDQHRTWFGLESRYRF